MFRAMRRSRQELSQDECRSLLERGTAGVLAVLGDEDYPYTVPLSYVLDGDRIYFHCAAEGHKMDALRKHDKVSFCVIAQDDIVPAELTTYFSSVVAFGRAGIVDDDERKRHALRLLIARFAPDHEEAGEKEIADLWQQVRVVEIAIEHMTGKAAIELIRQRQGKD